MFAMPKMQRALLPAAFGALLCSTAFGQAGAAAGGGIIKDGATSVAAGSRPRRLVEYTTSGGGQKLTIDEKGNAEAIDLATPSAPPTCAHLEAEEVAGLRSALGRLFRARGALVRLPAHETDPDAVAVVNWLDDVLRMTKSGVLADANKLFEAKLARPDRRGLAASGVIVTRGATPSAIRYEIDRTGRRKMLAARRLDAVELQTVYAMIELADPANAGALTPSAGRPDRDGSRAGHRLVMRFHDPIVAGVVREVDDATEIAHILPILPGDVAVGLLAP